MRERTPPPIEVVSDTAGALLYRVRLSPASLPPVRSGDLAESWELAREAAAASAWGEPRIFHFRPAEDDPVDLALTDTDASCWTEAVDAIWGLHTPYGLSLCLRLLGLVALLARSPALRALCPLARDGARLDPALLRAAATIPLSAHGHLDERRIFTHLGHAPPPSGVRPIVHSGAPR